MAASYSLAVWFGEKKMPFFISAICLCTIIATLSMNYIETMAARTYTGQGGTAFFFHEPWDQLNLPYRAIGGFFGTLAHWLFAA